MDLWRLVERVIGENKSGHISVRTHVRRRAQILRNSGGMSGVLESGMKHFEKRKTLKSLQLQPRVDSSFFTPLFGYLACNLLPNLSLPRLGHETPEIVSQLIDSHIEGLHTPVRARLHDSSLHDRQHKT